jgi:lipoprotein-releasing system ATP-binding protein
VHKNYGHGEKKVNVLRGISVSFEQGHTYAITGASGSGKSTLLQILGGLDQSSSGLVTYNNYDIFKFREGQKNLFHNNTVGFVFQFHYLLPEFTVLQIVMLPALKLKKKSEMQ